MVRILIVDDNIDYARKTGELLKKKGLDFVVASNPVEGIDQLQTGSFEAVITDKNVGSHRGVMPLLEFMERQREAIPVILYSWEDGAQAIQELYCWDFVEKELTPEATLPALEVPLKKYHLVA